MTDKDNHIHNDNIDSIELFGSIELDDEVPEEKKPKRKRPDEGFYAAIGILIFFGLFVLFFLWYGFKNSDRYEIPLMLLVKLVEKGNPNPVLNQIEQNEKSNNEDEQLPPAGELSGEEPVTNSPPFITVEEGKGKRIKTIRYSSPDEIIIGTHEVSGTIYREVITPKPKKLKPPKQVKFFSGRQGLNFDNNELFNQFRDRGFENVSAQGPPGFWEKYGIIILTAGLFLLVVCFMLGWLGDSLTSIGKNRKVQVATEDIKISFRDVAGVDEAVEELHEIVDFLQRPEKFQQLGGRIPKGVLLVGPPGTGKTLLAKAVAGEAGVPFFSISGSDFVEIYVGVGAARVRDLFSQAKKHSPCIIFIDELDAIGKKRASHSFAGNDEREQALNALLVEMDGFDGNSGTIVMAATNRPEILDSALLRSGRFDRQVLVDRPDLVGREEILKIHSRQVKLASDIDLRQIASITSGYVGADLAALVNEAALLAARGNKSEVTGEELTEAVERVTTGLQKKRRIMTESEKKRVSWHECGHAIVATLLPNADPVHKVSIIPRGIAALGYTLQRPEEERFLMTQKELQTQIAILLAGTIAEELTFEDISTGAHNDLQRATDIARSMVMNFGMSKLGRITYREPASPNYQKESGFVMTREHSEQTAWQIDQEVREIIESTYAKTKELLIEHKQKLDELATLLLEKEVIDNAELLAIIGSNSAKP